ncbi:hypothetical protein BDU57DRAFT_514511 [Ampelomyces quisqualis]|uniref:Uncharacterized protein n=1 Tax=Ampelomyces quisqualis TaxID=50730 RepID=A0A6A5QRI5_AMPQU|nr:hypothetical protein BDU57DRAFT_514511 [Ampelomyces quisqualis]
MRYCTWLEVDTHSLRHCKVHQNERSSSSCGRRRSQMLKHSILRRDRSRSSMLQLLACVHTLRQCIRADSPIMQDQTRKPHVRFPLASYLRSNLPSISFASIDAQLGAFCTT